MEELLLRSCSGGAEELRSQELLHERKGRVQVKGGVGLGEGCGGCVKRIIENKIKIIFKRLS